MKNHPALLVLVATLGGCAAAPPLLSGQPPAVHPVQQAVLWVQTSGEYRAAALQAWRGATQTLDQALADSTWSAATEQSGDFSHLPPAIVVDADETVIDNSPFEAQLVIDNATFSASRWSDWVGQRRAPAVPGAVAFLNAAAARGATVFYVTNRDHSDEAATLDNLRSLGLPIGADRDVLLTRGENGWDSDKGPRRAHVAKEFRIVLMAGDDLNDFVSGSRTAVAERLALTDHYRDYWGERWIVLPNPLYGSWERAVYGFESGLSDAQQQQHRLDALRP